MDIRTHLFSCMRSLLLAMSILGYSSGSSAVLIDFVTLGDSSEITTGDVVRFDLGILDFKPEPIAAFDLSLLFDNSVLQFESVVFGDFLGSRAVFETLESVDANLPGAVSISSLSLLPDTDLAAMQPAAFALASFEFLAIGPGASGFAFDTSAPFSGVVGSSGFELTTTLGAVPDVVVVTPPSQVSEPNAIGLLAIGLVAWRGRAVRKRKRSPTFLLSRAEKLVAAEQPVDR